MLLLLGASLFEYVDILDSSKYLGLFNMSRVKSDSCKHKEYCYWV